MADMSIVLPHGFRFHPTDEEIITHYLTPKLLDSSYTSLAIGEADLNKSEPFELPNMAKMGEKEWYFFCQNDRKYPTGTRTNRATKAGYWKATGKDKEIFNGKGVLVGMKKTLVFYTGRAPTGAKTNWVMHEFRIEGRLPRIIQDEWVVSRVFRKNMAEKKDPMDGLESNFSEKQQLDSAIPVLMDSSYFNPAKFGSSESPSSYKGKMEAIILDQEFVITDVLAETYSYSHFNVRSKVGQISNQSTMVSASQDTAGASKDWYTEISSLVPRNSLGFTYNFELHDPGTSADPGIDLGNICNY